MVPQDVPPAKIRSMFFEVQGQQWTMEVSLRDGAWRFEMRDHEGNGGGFVENVDPEDFFAALHDIEPQD